MKIRGYDDKVVKEICTSCNDYFCSLPEEALNMIILNFDSGKTDSTFESTVRDAVNYTLAKESLKLENDNDIEFYINIGRKYSLETFFKKYDD